MESDSDATCIECHKPIPGGAKKCTECGSYQDWRKHLAFSSTVLALLVALISVTGIVVPILKENLLARSPKLAATLATTSSNDVHVLVNNFGNLTGFVGRIRFYVDGVWYNSAAESIIPIGPEEFHLFSLKVDPDVSAIMASSQVCEVEIAILSEAMSESTKRLPFACSR